MEFKQKARPCFFQILNSTRGNVASFPFLMSKQKLTFKDSDCPLCPEFVLLGWKPTSLKTLPSHGNLMGTQRDQPTRLLQRLRFLFHKPIQGKGKTPFYWCAFMLFWLCRGEEGALKWMQHDFNTTFQPSAQWREGRQGAGTFSFNHPSLGTFCKEGAAGHSTAQCCCSQAVPGTSQHASTKPAQWSLPRKEFIAGHSTGEQEIWSIPNYIGSGPNIPPSPG